MSSNLNLPAHSVEACLQIINTTCFGVDDSNLHNESFTEQSLFTTPESLRSFANAINLNLEYLSVVPKKIEPKHLPCVLLTKDGQGLIVVGVKDLFLEILEDKKPVRKPILLVEQVVDGAIICPSPARELNNKNNIFQDTPTTQTASASPSKKMAKSHGFKALASEMTKRHRETLYLVMLASLLSNLLMIALPLFTMSVYDRVVPHGAMETLWALAIGVFIAISLDFALRYVKLKLSDAASIDTSTYLQSKLFKILTHTSIQETPRQASKWQNAFRDIDSASSLVPSLITAYLVDLPFVLITLALVYSIAQYTIFAPLAGITILLGWTFLSRNQMAKAGANEAEIHYEKTEMVQESASLIRTLKLTNSEPRMMSRFERLLDQSVAPVHQVRLQSGMQAQSMVIMVQAVIVLSIIIGVYQIVAGAMTVGALAATTLLTGRILMPAGNLMITTSRAAQFMPTINHVYELLDLQQEEAISKNDMRLVKQGEISLANVNFTFDGAPQSALNEISLTIRPGEKIAIIGRSGSGKSTLLQMFARIYEPSNGAITLDGFDIRQYSHREVREHVVYMPQETELLDGSIYDNIKLANPQASSDMIDEAIATSGAEDFIRNSAQGMSFQVGLRGEYLSGGERQSIGLARAVLRPSKVLLLDEPTSSMDNTIEARVIEKLKKNMGDKTMIIATHRANLLSLADRVIWLDKGKVIADASRDEVLAKMRAA